MKLISDGANRDREEKLNFKPQVQLEPTKVQKAEQAENLKHLFFWSTTDELFLETPLF